MKDPAETAWHAIDPVEVPRLLEVDLASGLSDEERTRREQQFGPNRMTPKRGTPAWIKFLLQFHQPLVYLLLAAVAVTGFLGEWIDASVILGVVLVNAVFGFLQESKAEKAIEALAQMVVMEVTVRRHGEKHRVPSESLVPGDVALLEAGDRVPADVRLLAVKNLQIDESSLTGESVPVVKETAPLQAETPLADRKNLAFAGTLVTAGNGEAMVWATGDRTETGNIARLISTAVDISTPLTEKIEQFSRLILWVIVGLAAAAFFIGWLRGEPIVQMFMAAVALAVGAIPEGLPAAVTVVLAIGVSRMAKRKAVIRKLPVVETLGSTTVICSDKTGTLTENQMTVREIFAGGEWYELTGGGDDPQGEIRMAGAALELRDHPALAECLLSGLLCNDAHLHPDDEGRLKSQGDPTEAALLIAAEKGGLRHAEARDASPRIDTIPFESEQMYRATLNAAAEMRVIYMAGAAERLLDRCHEALDQAGQLAPLDQTALRQAMDQMASRGLRVLAFARRHVEPDHAELEHEHVAEGLTFLGLQGMIDPPRAEAIAAVRRCQEAGIIVKMITGDHLATARAIAGQIGIQGTMENGQLRAISGSELEKVSRDALPQVAEETVVFARVSPEQKLRLVQAMQSRGHVVAMTGDGVNDAPALKQADIGVAMGRSGTEVAKGAAAMVLTDDNFASIEAAVEEGRGVFDNLTKFIVWILPTNLGEALLLIAAILFNLPLPVLPLQILWINLTDTLLGLPLTFETKEADLMRRPPRNPEQPLLTRPLIMRTGLVSLFMVIGGLSLFLYELHIQHADIAQARTTVVNVIVLIEAVYLFNCRSLTHPVSYIGWFSNRWAIAGALSMLAAQIFFTHAPIMHRLFHSAGITPAAWLRIAGLSLAVFAVVEFEKWLRFGRKAES